LTGKFYPHSIASFYGVNMKQPQALTWDTGSAYDLFVSLWILHRSDEFGLRPSWAAGVRSRIPSPLRVVLEESQKFIRVPLAWIHTLPQPKDAKAAQAELHSLAPEDRLPALVFDSKQDERTRQHLQFLQSLDGKQRLTTNIENQIKTFYRDPNKATKDVVRATFDAWSNRKAFGERFYEALAAYVNNFYTEEEARIIPAQSAALAQAQALAENTDLLTLIETLSSGVRMDWISEVAKLVLAPSFWGAPFVFFDYLDAETGIILFGARPKGITLVPGEVVPEDLLNALKALADPTRLRILRYLLEGASTPSELAKTLRLRPPTVIHHLHSLRLAGLVSVNVSAKTERLYTARRDGVLSAFQSLNQFLSGE
jgi:DNA-binding transcriptional ArsR family regulator